MRRVIATDASAAQIGAAIAHSGVDYRVARAEDSALEAQSIDLITVAQAAHWLDLESFYAEARRVAQCDAVIGLWSYGYFVMTPEIDEIVERFAEVKLRTYWPAASRIIRDRYRTIPFPFSEIASPSFEIQHSFSLAELELYFRSWSGVERFIVATREDPVPDAMTEIAAVWGDPEKPRAARFELFLRVGRMRPN